MFQEIKKIYLDVIDTFRSCIFHASDLLIDSSTKDAIIFFVFFLLVLAITIFYSNSQVEFYINLLKILFILVITYFIFCISDYFWFVIKKRQVYKLNLENKKNINGLLKEMDYSKSMEEEDVKKQILSIVKFYANDLKTGARMYVIEISFLLILLLFIDPLFFLFNIALFGGMFFYVFLYEGQSVNQAFDDTEALLYCIYKLNKENPDKCKRFITKNNLPK
ncbi:MAG: hypothetical protein Q7K55_06150 [Candidatus Levybacteria bacterium]|nr:hypothetical protein [Candidatus Levybacteria bacterium]